LTADSDLHRIDNNVVSVATPRDSQCNWQREVEILRVDCLGLIQVEKSESGGGLICWVGENTHGASTSTNFDFFGGKRRPLAPVEK